MPAQDEARAAPAATECDPQVDRLVGAINTSNSTSSEAAATPDAQHGRDWWRAEAARVDSNWRGLLALLYLLGSKPGCTMFMKLWQIGVAGRAHGAAIELRRKGGTAEAAT